MRYLGIDWGGKRIGLALADSETKIATPFSVVSSLEEIKKIIKQEEINEIVIGLPLKMGGGENLSDEFTYFLNKLKGSFNIPIHKIDERLSSKAADALVGGKKTKAQRDAVAAMIILQTYLDKKNGSDISNSSHHPETRGGQ